VAPPVVSVLIASDRVEGSLSETLASLDGQAPPDFEVLVASAKEPPRRERSFPLRWIEVAERNPAVRRNRAAAAASGRLLAFLDDDATAERGWLAAGARALESSDAAGGPDPGPDGAPYGERLANLLLATPVIGSGVPAHGPGRAPARSARRTTSRSATSFFGASSSSGWEASTSGSATSGRTPT
jgi:hypothetical protein